MFGRIALAIALASAISAQDARETFLREAPITAERRLGPGVVRVTLDDGARQHDATLQTAEPGNQAQRDILRLNIAAYELDKLLGLRLVQPSVERTVRGLPAVLTWWADSRAMSEQERRRNNIAPPDPARWNRQMQSVRMFDELISNSYRSTKPELYLTSLWDNLLIAGDWSISLIDHKAAFRTARVLDDPASFLQCDRRVLVRLSQLNGKLLREKLERYLTPEELDGLDARRRLLVEHFRRLIVEKGENAVLFDGTN